MNKKFKLLIDFSFLMVKISHSSDVLYEDWLKCYILYSKALFLDNKFDEALELLRGLLDIFVNIPLDGIKYVSEINKKNKISLKNNFIDNENIMNFYSKYHIYTKCEAIFCTRLKKKDNKFNWSIKEIILEEENSNILIEKKSMSLIQDKEYIFKNQEIKGKNNEFEDFSLFKNSNISFNKSDDVYFDGINFILM